MTGDALVPDTDTDLWWRTTLEPWWRDFDELGHMTAASYPAAFEEAYGRFMIEHWQRTDPSYVVARIAIDYLHEVRRDTLPVTIYVQPVRVGRSAVEVNLVLRDSMDLVCTTAQTRYVAWDKSRRCSRPFTDEERASLRATARG